MLRQGIEENKSLVKDEKMIKFALILLDKYKNMNLYVLIPFNHI